MGFELSPRPTGTINGWWPVYKDAELRAFQDRGETALLGDGHDVLASRVYDTALVRVHRVTSGDEYLALTNAYRDVAAENSFSTDTFDHTLVCLFRGQTRDYKVGEILVSQPTAFRTPALAHEYLSLERETSLTRDWQPWARAIREITKVEDESGDLYDFSDPLQPHRHVAPRKADRTLSGRLTTNTELMALGMHYGFPTASLDVTPDEHVALWFALNAGSVDGEGRIRYDANLGTPGEIEGPSVYVYIQRSSPENPVVDLTAGSLTPDRASRPFVQRAWAMPFHIHATRWMGDMDAQFGSVSGPALRWPSAVIKPVFKLEEAERLRTMYRAEELFPPDDPLYRALADLDAPRLARYAV
jgi:hypothetical protein